MTYEWEARLDNITLTGMDRAVEMVKQGVKEMPRLQNELNSNVMERHLNAKKEAIALLQRLDKELTQIKFESHLSSEEFFKTLRTHTNLTPEEKQALFTLPGLLKIYGIDLLGFKTKAPTSHKRKKNIRFKA